MIDIVDYTDKFREFSTRAKNATLHTAKYRILVNWLKDIFGVEDFEIERGTEKYMQFKFSGDNKRGRIDLILPAIVIEQKMNLKKELEVMTG